MKLFDRLKKYGISPQGRTDIVEATEALDNLHNLPISICYSLQSICDLFNVCLSFHNMKDGKLLLTGINNKLLSSYLVTSELLNKSQKLMKESESELYLIPNGKEQLHTVEELNALNIWSL
tara:strand:- start:15227 stop:15589 length:363 start_codon:yes stop_codon:yes gene_type:complete